MHCPAYYSNLLKAMNILPKKRWHVRTKENIARVRKDEAEAAEKEKQEQLRTEKADREARLSVLKQKSKQKLIDQGITESQSVKELPAEHINLFANFEDAVKSSNKEHDKEVKDKKEEYEKKIGYLTYLGQDTNEALGKKNWYEVLPESSRFSRSNNIKDTYEKLLLKDEDGNPKTKEQDITDGEVSRKKKQILDPMNSFKHLSHHSPKRNYDKNPKESESYSNKKTNKHILKNEEKEKQLQKLREARLKRELQEKHRTELFLSGINKPVNSEPEKETRVTAKYNSQFNPELARQNYR